LSQSRRRHLLTISLAYAASADLLAAATARPPASLRNWRGEEKRREEVRKGNERSEGANKKRGEKAKLECPERRGEQRTAGEESMNEANRTSSVRKGQLWGGSVVWHDMT
jgi:hypothetical protein